MGFFDKKVQCDVCGNETGLNRFKFQEGWICPDCFKRAGYKMTTPIKKKTLTEIKADTKAYAASQKKLTDFTPTKKIGNFFEVDEKRKQWLVPDGFFGGKKNPRIYEYKDILDCELLEDGDSLTKGGLGRAVAGGLLFGGVGAIVGGATGRRKTKSVVTSLKVKITVKNAQEPAVYIPLIKTTTKTNSFTYKALAKSAQDIVATIAVIMDENRDASADAGVQNTAADEIRKYKQLLDEGVITEKEFADKKKQLLGL